jgi:hypothetical protein
MPPKKSRSALSIYNEQSTRIEHMKLVERWLTTGDGRLTYPELGYAPYIERDYYNEDENRKWVALNEVGKEVICCGF